MSGSPSKQGPTAIFLFGRRVTPWRDRRKASIEDAITAGYATREDWPQSPVFWSVGVQLIERRA